MVIDTSPSIQRIFDVSSRLMYPIFVFRFYVEVDKDGKDLPGYQHPQRHAYRLTFDNNGDAWRFTSNFQVISVVQMLRHEVLPGQIFVMRKDELKTVLLKV